MGSASILYGHLSITIFCDARLVCHHMTKDYLVAWDESGYLFVKEEWFSSAADFQQLVSWFRASVPEGSRESLRRFLFKLNGSAIHEDNSSE